MEIAPSPVEHNQQILLAGSLQFMDSETYQFVLQVCMWNLLLHKKIKTNEYYDKRLASPDVTRYSWVLLFLCSSHASTFCSL